MKLRHLTHYALQGLRTGGQHVLIAVLAVAFGVMSLIAMAACADAIFEVMLLDPRYAIGGDAELWRESRYLSEEEVTQVAQADGVEVVTAVANTQATLLKTPGSGRVTFLRTSAGIDPAAYPLFGELVLQSGQTPAEVLQQPGDAIITGDLARERDLAVGDTFLVGSRLGGPAQPLQVTAIAVQTPSRHEGSLYFDLATAAELAGHPTPITDVYVRWAPDATPEAIAATRAALAASGWQIYPPDGLSDSVREIRTTFNLMLKGAGILGLIVGGIGIANTMQAVLARRREEVAVLKTMGYARRDIMLLFGLETAAIGLTGSVLGAAAGVALSAILVDIAGGFVTLTLDWVVAPGLIAGGIAVGVVTTLLFAANAILRASDVRPADVFRQLSLGLSHAGRYAGWRGLVTRARSALTFALMAVPFTAIAGLVLGSVWQGAAVLGAAVAGLIVVGGLLAGITWLVLRLLPTFRFHLLRMARNNMRRRGFSLVFAMIALCAGTFTLGLAVVIIGGSVEEFQARMFSTTGLNMLVLSAPAQAGDAAAVLAQHSDTVGVRYELPLQAAATADGRTLSASLQGRDALWDVAVTGAPWGTAAGAAYVPADAIAAGQPLPESVVVTDLAGATHTLPVAGRYEVAGTWDRQLLPVPTGLLVDAAILTDLGGEALAVATAQVPPRELDAIAEEIGAALPDLMVVTAADLNAGFNATYQNIFTFAVIMAGLALVAGAVLIANAVGMAMIERRHEIGVLKAMGYTRWQVLRTILLEYGLIAAIAGGLGLLGVVAFVAILSLFQDLEAAAEVMAITPLGGLAIILLAIAMAEAAALLAAWSPTSVRPLVVLNEQG